MSTCQHCGQNTTAGENTTSQAGPRGGAAGLQRGAADYHNRRKGARIEVVPAPTDNVGFGGDAA